MATRLLEVSVQSVETIRPKICQKQSHFFLSNIDHGLVYPFYTIHVFQRNPQHPFAKAVETFKAALPELLQNYYFLAGRLSMNTEQGRLEISCDGKGVPFAVARANPTLEEIGPIMYPHDDFKCLVLNCGEDGLLSFQMTEFPCGGFVLAMGINHATLDGISISRFLDDLASVAAGHGIKTPPFIDRTVLKARSPPRVEYEHVELVPLEARARTLYANEEHAQFRGFALSGDAVASLQRAASAGEGGEQCSAFAAVTAHLWRARTAALQMAPHDTSSVMFAVDIRRHMDPPLPAEFAGNAVLPGYACAAAGELMAEGGYAKCVKMVTEGIRRVRRDSYVRSCIDWLEMHKFGGPRTERECVFVTSWWTLKMHEVKYPWGVPVYAGTAFHTRTATAILLPRRWEPNGVSVYIALPPDSVSVFSSVFFAIPELTNE